MKHIVLVNPDMELLQERFCTVTLTKLKAQPPLGLCAIAAPLEAAGHKVNIVDGYAESLPPAQLADRVRQFQPDLVGFSVTCLNAAQAEETATILKTQKASIKIIFGGPQTTLQSDSAMKCPAVDYAITGEGDLIFPQLIEALETDRDLSPLPGLTWRDKNGDPREGAPPQPVTDLNSLPMPARHLLDWNNYNLSGDYLIPARKVMTLSTSRGCPYQCTFCSSAVYWNCSYRALSAHAIVNEIEALIEQFGADGLNFREDNFMVNRKRVKDICHEMLKRKISIPWVCEARVDNVDRDTLEIMREAGMVGLWCGVESGSPRILKQIRKGYTVEQVRTAFKLFNELNINTRAGFMIGFPHETEEDIEQTYRLAEEISPSHAYFQTYVAFPRGELYEEVVSNGYHCDQWRDVYRVNPCNIPADRYMELEENLRRRFEEYKLKRHQKPEPMPDLGSRILVFCTSGMPIIESVLHQILQDNPNVILETLSNQALAKRIQNCDGVNQHYTYTTNHVQPSTLEENDLQPLRENHYDTIIITFSNSLGQGYEEVINTAFLLRPDTLLSYNRLGTVSTIDNNQPVADSGRQSHDCELSAP